MIKLVRELELISDVEYSMKVRRFFKSKYCPNDVFMGIRVPAVRLAVKAHAETLTPEMISQMLKDNRHEVRMAGLLSLVHLYQTKGDSVFLSKDQIIQFYLNHLEFVDNWDLVDISAHKLLGDWLNQTFLEGTSREWNSLMVALESPRISLWDESWKISELFPPWYARLLNSNDFWEIRVSIVLLLSLKSTHPDIAFLVCRWHLNRLLQRTPVFIKNMEFDDYDLIHKAIGWILRESGKASRGGLMEILNQFANVMPRTTVCYCTEKFPSSLRKSYINKSSMKNQ